MRVTRLALVVVVPSAMAACSLMTGLGGFTGDGVPDDAEDAAPTSLDGTTVPSMPDGATAADAASADAAPDAAGDADGAPALLKNGGFEESGAQCGAGWSLHPLGATAERSTEARSGAFACRLCVGSADYADLRADVVPPPAAGKYALRAYASSSDGGANSLVLILDQDFVDGGGSRAFTHVYPADGYKFGEIIAGSDENVVRLRPVIRVTGQPGTCYLVDDVALDFIP